MIGFIGHKTGRPGDQASLTNDVEARVLHEDTPKSILVLLRDLSNDFHDGSSEYPLSLALTQLGLVLTRQADAMPHVDSLFHNIIFCGLRAYRSVYP
jgi:hypothetical protein